MITASTSSMDCWASGMDRLSALCFIRGMTVRQKNGSQSILISNPNSSAWQSFQYLNRDFENPFMLPHSILLCIQTPTPPTVIKHKPTASCKMMSFLAHEPLEKSSWIINRVRECLFVSHQQSGGAHRFRIAVISACLG